MTKVALVTVDYNNHEDTSDFLESVKSLDTKGLEILNLVVDNGSEVSVKETVKKFSNVTWLQTGKNIGFAGGFNRGMQYAKEWGADFVLIVNNDTVLPDRNVLKNLLKVFKENPKVGLVSPKIYFAPGYEFFKERYTKSDQGKVIWYAGGHFDWDNVRSVHRGIDLVDKGDFDSTEKTGFVSGCCVLVKREVLEKVGYFDEKLFAYYEDNDWFERIKKAGFESWYAGSTYIYHKVSRTSVIGSSWSDYLISRNRLWFGMKYGSARTKFALWREAFKHLLIGRPDQKDGVLDYLKGVWGWKKVIEPKDVEYPVGLSIVIINYKTTDLTLQLLKSIFDGSSGFTKVKGGGEVIVLDNSPEESSKSAVRSRYPQVKFISNPENNGFSKAVNQMIKFSLGKNVFLLNSDMKVEPGSIVKMFDAVSLKGERAVYSGRLLFPDGRVQDSCYMLPTPWHAFEEYFLGKKGSYFMYSLTGSSVTKVEGAVMACYLIPKRIINEIGLLEEETFMYFEDIEYSRRAMRNNIPVYYVPDAKFIHYHGQSSKQAGVSLSNDRLVEASKWYHGKLQYFLVTSILWAGQKFGRVIAPVSEWEKDK